MNLEGLELNNKMFNMSYGFLKAIAYSMDKRELYKRVDLDDFMQTIFNYDVNFIESSIYKNWNGCEFFTPEETKPMYDWIKTKYEEEGLGALMFETEKDGYRDDNEEHIFEIFTHIPSLYINLYQDGKLDLDRYYFSCENEVKSSNTMTLNYQDESIPFVSFFKKNGLLDDIRQNICQKMLWNYVTMIDNKSLTQGLQFVYKNSNDEKIIYKEIERVLKMSDINISKIRFTTFNVIENPNIEKCGPLTELNNFHALKQEIIDKGILVEYDKKEYKKYCDEIIDKLSDEEKMKYREQINVLYPKPEQKQRKPAL